MTRPLVGARVRILGDPDFAGREGVLVEWRRIGRKHRVRVQLDHDAGYSWLFARGEVEVIG